MRKIKLLQEFDARDVPAYTPAMAAHHLNIPLPTLRSWTRGRSYPRRTSTGWFEPLVEPARQSPLMLSFTNLVELHMLNLFRAGEQIELARIRRAIDYLRGRYGRHPLATQAFLTDGKDVIVEVAEGLVNASQYGQMRLERVATFLLQRIERDEEGLGKLFYPVLRRDLSEPEEATEAVEINPRVAFGRPVVVGTRIPTELLFERVNGGVSIGRISEETHTDRELLREALAWERAAREKAA